MDLGVLATVFGLIFVAELPDKTAIASLVLGAKFRASWVFAGVATAFAVHVVIAVAAGSVIGLLPRRPVEAIVGILFAVGGVLLWFRGASDDEADDDVAMPGLGDGDGFSRVAAASFLVIFVAEWGDLTQILCANLAARYHAPITVGVGSVLGLWAVGLLAILGGRSLLRVLPIIVLVRVAAAAMMVLAVYGIVGAVLG